MTLGAYISQCSRRTFGWGIWDCCLFAADAVKCLKGKDPAAPLRATYANEWEARRLTERIGGITAIVTGAGLTPVSMPFRDGDIGVVRLPHKMSSLVVYWQGQFLGVGSQRGLMTIATRLVGEVFRA